MNKYFMNLQKVQILQVNHYKVQNKNKFMNLNSHQSKPINYQSNIINSTQSNNKNYQSNLNQQNPQSPRLYDHLQSIYNHDAFQNKNFAKQQKQLYYKIVQQNQKRKLQKRSLQKQIKQHQNQQIDIFWKNRQNELRQRQKRHKQAVDQTRNANKNIYSQNVSNNALSRSMVIPSNYQIAQKNQQQDIALYEYKKQKQKQNKQKFLSQGQLYHDFKHYQQYLQKQSIVQAQRKKLIENQEIEHKRLQQLDKWRKKYLQAHNKQAFDIWDKARKSRLSQQDALQNYIVFQGARQLNERTSKMKNQVFQRQNAKKQQYIRQLHSQLQDNQHRTQNDIKNQRSYQRKIIEERNQLLAQKDRLMKQVKYQQNKEHLQVLKSQHKPRILLPEKQKVQFPGLGSPVHIGKVIGDDRRRQLQWLQKNLYKELSH